MEEKQQVTKAKIVALAKEVSYEELAPLFGTAKKKVGTRIAAMLILGVYLNEQSMTDDAWDFIEAGMEDDNELLKFEANEVSKFYV